MKLERSGWTGLRRGLWSLGLAALFLVSGPATADGESRYVVRVYYDSVEDAQRLGEYDLFEFNDKEERYFLVGVDLEEHERLIQMGFRTEVDSERSFDLEQAVQPVPTGAQAIPGFDCYRTVEETYATAQDIVFAYPQLASWINVGDSWEKTTGTSPGYDLMVLRLTNAAIPGPKPAFFVTSSIHAREYTPAELNTRFAEHLVQNYDVDPDVTWVLDHHEIHLMLMANPDGRKKAETGLSWRKNTDQNYCSPTSNSRGADLNRNFDFEWGCCGGSSGSECSNTYRGPTPASEPETQAIQAYMQSIFPDHRPDDIVTPSPLDAEGLYFDVHSYSELVLWPWGFGGTVPNPTLETLGRKLAFFNGYTPQEAIDLYPTDGTTIDFAYGDLGVAAFVYELGTAFFQNCPVFENEILPDNLQSLLYASKVVRNPYQAPLGPEALDLRLFPSIVAAAGETVVLTAEMDDTRFNNSNGIEPVQDVVAAEYYVDVPPWDTTGIPVAHPMTALDGGPISGTITDVGAAVDTYGLDPGRHTIFVRGQDAAGNWGPFSAAFLFVADDDWGGISGTVIDRTTGQPVAARIDIEPSGSSVYTDASGEFDLHLPDGSWSLTVHAPGFKAFPSGALPVSQGQTIVKFFPLSPVAPILLVDDDDNAPNVRAEYMAALASLGRAYDVWDNGGTDAEPGSETLAGYETVIWFSGGENGSSAGPSPTGESALDGWLDDSACLLVASQDYYADRGLTSFMQGKLAVSSVADDMAYGQVTGVGSVFGGFGSSPLSFPYDSGVDVVDPVAAGAPAFLGGAESAAIAHDAGLYRSSYWGFGLEAIDGATDREAALGAFLTWCDDLAQVDADADGIGNGADCDAADPLVWSAPGPVVDLVVDRDGPDNLRWSAPAQPGSSSVTYDLVRGGNPVALSIASCVVENQSATTATDTFLPAIDHVAYYVVRATNSCGATVETRSDGLERSVRSCP